MKVRWLAIVTALAVLGACGGDDDDAAPDTTTDTEQTQADSDETTVPDTESDTDETTAPDDTEASDTEASDAEEAADTTARDAEDSPDSSGEGCQVDVTGGFTTAWDGPDDVGAVSSDYWSSDEELQQLLETLGDPDPAATLEQRKASGEPILALLLLGCSGPDGAYISLTPSNATTRNELPFEPGSHPIAGGFLSGAETPAGSFLALATMPGESETDTIWGFDEEAAPGTLEITSWDNSSIEGTFTFSITESLTDTPLRAVVNGSFSFSCKGSSTC